MDVDYSCYEGREVRGAADTVLSRGKIVVDAGEFLGSPGDGRFVKRQRSSVVAAG
jgi:dihydropyrimidinase